MADGNIITAGDDLTFLDRRYIRAQSQGIYNVKDYGAKGDNSTDDTISITNAYNAAIIEGGVIFFPPGNYKTALGVNGNSANVIWRGSGLKSLLIATSTNPAITLTGQSFVEDIVFDGGNTSSHAAVQSVVSESSYPSLWKNVVWQNATSYQYVNTKCEDVTYLECRTQGDESNPTGVLPGIQVNVPTGMVRIIGGAIFGKCDLNYQQLQITGAVIGPLVIENANPQNNTILSLDGCYIYDGGASSNSCIDTGNNLTNIAAKGCYFVGQAARNWINGNIPSGVTITLDECVFVWGPQTAGNNYVLSASGAGTLELRNYSTDLGSATFNIFNAVSSPTTIITTLPNEHSSAVASANTLTLPSDANIFHISGTTQINLINIAQWKPGTVITLIFEGIVTVKNNQASSGTNKPIILNAATDFTSANNNTLTLVYDSIGAAWFEVARKV